MKRDKMFSVIRLVLVGIFAIPWIVVPLWLVLVSSFKTPGEAARLQLTLPAEWAIVENYTAVFTQGGYGKALVNSLLVSVPTIIVVVLVGAAAAWAFGRSRRVSMQTVFYAIALSMLVPPTLIPTIYLLREIGLNGSMLGYVLVMIGTRMGVLVFLATGFVRNMPVDLEAAAEIDGANRLQVFFQIILPLLSPVLFVGGIFILVTVWGDFFFAQFLIPGTATQTLPLSLYSFASSSAQTLRWNLVFAHVAMTGLPLLIAFILAQRKVIGGLSEGAVKG